MIYVHSPDDAVNVPGQPWAGLPADRSVRDLLLYLDCRLSENYWMARTTFCESALRELGTVRFRMDRANLDAADRNLFAAVRDVLVGAGPGAPERTISRDDLTRFYERALPGGISHLPFVIRIGNTNHSWFVPNSDHSEYTSALNLDDNLRLAVLTDRAMRPVGLAPAAAVYGPAGAGGAVWGSLGDGEPAEEEADANDGPIYRWLEDTRRLVGFVQGIRPDPDTRGLQIDDRRVLFKMIVNTLRQKVPRTAAVPPSRAPSSSVASSSFSSHSVASVASTSASNSVASASTSASKSVASTSTSTSPDVDAEAAAILIPPPPIVGRSKHR